MSAPRKAHRVAHTDDYGRRLEIIEQRIRRERKERERAAGRRELVIELREKRTLRERLQK